MKQKEAVSEMVIGFVKRTLPELKYEEIDTNASMKELGVTSIDILEVVSASMKKLEVQIPRDQLNQLTCIEDLINLLTSIVEAKEAKTV